MRRAGFPWAWTLVLGVLAGPVVAVGAPISIPTSPMQRPSLKSIYSEVHQVSDFKKPGIQAIVFAFLGIECPVSQQYIPRLNAIQEQFAKRHVQFVAIYADASVNVLSMATHAHDNDIAFPVFLDEGQRLADLLEVTVVPEVVVLDSKWEKRFQGAIDNQFKKRGNLAEATKHYLTHALDQILANEVLDTPTIPASGCPLERHRAQQAQGGPSDLTFHRDIEPLVQKHCQTCHRPEGVAPFELTTFDDVSSNTDKIEAVGSSRVDLQACKLEYSIVSPK